MQSKKPMIITAALPYANGSIHLGHLVGYIQTDIFTRFQRLIGENALFCWADDAHGTAIEIRAQKEGIKPEDFIAQAQKEHEEDFKRFLISYDNYHSTHSEENKELAEEIFLKLKEKGLIYTKEVESLYDEEAGRFLPDRYVKGGCPKCDAEDQYGDSCEVCNSTYKATELINPYSVITKSTPVKKSSLHYFYKLSATTEQLKEYFATKSFQPEVMNYINNWIEEGLQDWDISRDGPYFGFTIPGEENSYFYVWFDAPIGYLASLKNYCTKNNLNYEETFTKETKLIHFIGKDIMYFHFLFWPSVLLNADLPVPQDIHVNGFLTVNKQKMSKSRGTFINAKDFADTYPAEYLRYYFAKVSSKKLSDLDYNEDHFLEVINNELVSNIANLCYRTLSFTNKNYNSELVDYDGSKYSVLEDSQTHLKKIKAAYAESNLNRALSEILELAAVGNKFFQENAPWLLRKDGKEQEAKEVCAVTTSLVKDIVVALSPILPQFSEDLAKQIGLSTPLTWEQTEKPLKGTTINKAEIIARKLEKKEEEMFPLRLKVATILEAKKHPDSEKLMIVKAECGEEKPRQVVAGIQQFFSAEELLGKQIIIVSNLKAAKLGGELSQGMLLAASKKKEGDESKEDLYLLSVPKVTKPGTELTIPGMKNNPKEIQFKDFMKVSMSTKEGKITVKEYDTVLMVGGKELTHSFADGFTIG